MQSLCILLSIAIFLLLPYYLVVFLEKQKYILGHIIFGVGVNALVSILYILMYNTIASPSLLLLIACIAYYFFSYIFYVRSFKKDSTLEQVKLIVQAKYTKRIVGVVIVAASVLLIADITLILDTFSNEKTEVLDKAYLIGILVIAYLQNLIYVYTYNRMSQKSHK